MRSVLKTLHGFTEKVIAERKQELEEKKGDGQVEEVLMLMLMLMLMLIKRITQKTTTIVNSVLHCSMPAQYVADCCFQPPLSDDGC